MGCFNLREPEVGSSFASFLAALFLGGMDRGHLQAETSQNLMQQLLSMPMKHIETCAVRML